MNTGTAFQPFDEGSGVVPSESDYVLDSVHLLAGRRLQTMLTANGSGYVRFDELAVTRWHPDLCCDPNAYSIYVRDLDREDYWSVGIHPTLKQPDEYEARFVPGIIEYTRSDSQISTQTEVCQSPTDNLEIRRCTVTNHSTRHRRIELTSYAELILQEAAADAGHPAFSKLFVETELVAGKVLFARRRPRQADESPLSACHFLSGGFNSLASYEFETSRERFLGRGSSIVQPAAICSEQSLTGTIGSVLDPIFSLRRILFLAPNESASVSFLLAADDDRDNLLGYLERYRSEEAIHRTFEAARLAAEQQLTSLGISRHLLPELNQLAATSLFGLGHQPTIGRATGQNGEPPGSSLDVKQIRQYFEAHRIPSLRESPSSTNAFCQSNSIDDEYKPADVEFSDEPHDFNEPLQHFNGLGGFSQNGREYVIQLRRGSDGRLKLPPMPWNNVVSNPGFGFIISEIGSCFTWAGNSRQNRLTPWFNDPISDPTGEALYLRDEASSCYWSIMPGPVPQAASYEVRHGWGYSKFRHTTKGLHHEVVQFVPTGDPVKITLVRLHNQSDRPRRLTLFHYVQWELCDGRLHASRATRTSFSVEHEAILAQNANSGEFSHRIAFSTMTLPENSEAFHFTTDRQEFLANNRTLHNPRAICRREPLSGRTGQVFDPCAACQADVVIPPGGTIDIVVLLGQGENQTETNCLLKKYRSLVTCAAALEEVQQTWRECFDAVQIETPSSAINLMVNGWVPYQNLSCRVWGRSSSYQAGGAYGFRDQLQDCAGLMHLWPELTREQILRHAAHQFIEGDVLHWWHPPSSTGIRTNFSDDLLWLPLLASEYVQTTGDDSLWREEVRYLDAEPVPPGEPELVLTPVDSGRRGTLYEHCCRALDRGLTAGRHGLPLMGCGDWNDGMNRVGQAGKGESIWLGFFIDYILQRMFPVIEARGDTEQLKRYRHYRQQLRQALDDAGWDGGWYRRAYFDDGAPLGTASAEECRIDALVQAWSVLSGAASAEHRQLAIAAVDENLVDEQAGIIRLLTPPCDRMKNDPGYIKGYLPGVRENGGQYTHGVLWYIRAVAEMGHGSRAAELLEMISPVSHGSTAVDVEIYKAEPYVIAADVYGEPPHVGRAGWSWYTGSAGWMWRVAVESILGIQLIEGRILRINPSISADWPECRVRYRLADRRTVYDIRIQNPHHREHGVSTATLDGSLVSVGPQGAEVPLDKDGRFHLVTVQL